MILEQEIKKAQVRLMVAVALFGIVICGAAWALVTYQESLLLTLGVVFGIAFIENCVLFLLVRRLNAWKAMLGSDEESQDLDS